MAIIIIGTVLVLTGIVFAIFKKRKLSVVLGIIGLSFILGAIIIILSMQSYSKANKIREELNTEISTLNIEYYMLSQQDLSQLWAIYQLSEYHNRVREYKDTISKMRMLRNNFFVKSFIPSVYEEYTGQEVNYFGGTISSVRPDNI